MIFLVTYWRYIATGLAAVALFYAGYNVASSACEADKAKLVAAQLEQQTKTIEKVRYVQKEIARLPTGAASNKLFSDWSRQ